MKNQLFRYSIELFQVASIRYLEKVLEKIPLCFFSKHYIYYFLEFYDMNLFSTLHWENFLFASNNIFLLLGKKKVVGSDKRVRNGAMIFCLTLATLECKNVWKFQANIFVGKFRWKYLWRAFRQSSATHQQVINQSPASHQPVISESSGTMTFQIIMQQILLFFGEINT